MKIEIIKQEFANYKAGDVLSIENPYGTKNYLLYQNNREGYIGLLDLSDGSIYKEVSPNDRVEFTDLILEVTGSETIEDEKVHEWKVFSGNEIKLILGANI